jgi:hypothetical protein
MIIGSTIRPELLVNDYSGYANAGSINGQAMAQFGKDIGGAITGAAGLYKEGKQMQGQVDAAKKGYDSLAKAFPAYSELFQTQSTMISDPNISLAAKIAQLNQNQNMLGMMVQMKTAENADKSLAAKLGASSAKAGAGNPY